MQLRVALKPPPLPDYKCQEGQGDEKKRIHYPQLMQTMW